MTLAVNGVAPLLHVYDMPTALSFYRDLLGFAVTGQSQPRDECDWAMLQLGDAVLMLNTAYDDGERPGSPEPARVAAHLDTCLYFGCSDVDAAYELLRARGIVSDPPRVAWYGMKQLYFKDPDGYQLCFQWPAKP